MEDFSPAGQPCLSWKGLVRDLKSPSPQELRADTLKQTRQISSNTDPSCERKLGLCIEVLSERDFSAQTLAYQPFFRLSSEVIIQYEITRHYKMLMDGDCCRKNFVFDVNSLENETPPGFHRTLS